MEPQDKFTAVYDQYADAIFRHCLLRIYDRELAMDLMQETFLKAWKYLSEGNKVDNVRALLYKIATNLIIDHVRKPGHKKVDSLEDLLESGFEPGEDRTEDTKSAIDAKDALKILTLTSDTYREVLLLRYLDDLSVKQIAETLGISENLVSVRINRALEDLRNRAQSAPSKKSKK